MSSIDGRRPDFVPGCYAARGIAAAEERAASAGSKLTSARRSSRSEPHRVAASTTDHSLGELLERHRHELTESAEKVLSRGLQRRMSASDLVQETMLSASTQFHSYQGRSAGEFRAWLLEIFHSRLVDGIRRHRIAECRRLNREEGIVTSETAGSTLTPSTLMSRHEETARLRDALSRLPDEARSLIQMRYVEELTFDEIAIRCGVSAATVWRRWVEAVRSIQKIVSPA